MSTFLSIGPAFAENKSPKIVVIGGGLAGLTTAYRLQQGGMDVELYEARNRVGGRVFSVNIFGNVAELGGQNITDGGDAPNMLRLIHEFNLELRELQVPMSHSFFDGKDLISMQPSSNEKRFNERNLRAQLDKLQSGCLNMREVLDTLFEKNSVLYRDFATRLAAYEGGAIEKLSSDYVETLFYMISGGLSSVHQEDYVNLVSLKDGNSRLPEKIAETLDGRLHLNMPLTHVSEEVDGTYALVFENGQKVRADILILAIPCSVFEQIEFQEDLLDKERLDAMKSLPYGTNAKILVPFTGIPSHRNSLVEDHMISFFGNESILTIYCTDEASFFSADGINSSVCTKSRPAFDGLFKEVCFSSEPVVYAKDQASVHYSSPVCYSWPNDPYAQGSYSYVGAGQEALLTSIHKEDGEKFKTLFAPIKHKLFFVGEHTTVQEDIRGTMEAACESGERCARLILKKYGNPSLYQSQEIMTQN